MIIFFFISRIFRQQFLTLKGIIGLLKATVKITFAPYIPEEEARPVKEERFHSFRYLPP